MAKTLDSKKQITWPIGDRGIFRQRAVKENARLVVVFDEALRDDIGWEPGKRTYITKDAAIAAMKLFGLSGQKGPFE